MSDLWLLLSIPAGVVLGYGVTWLVDWHERKQRRDRDAPDPAERSE